MMYAEYKTPDILLLWSIPAEDGPFGLESRVYYNSKTNTHTEALYDNEGRLVTVIEEW